MTGGEWQVAGVEVSGAEVPGVEVTSVEVSGVTVEARRSALRTLSDLAARFQLVPAALVIVLVPLVMDPFTPSPLVFTFPKLTFIHLLVATGLGALLLDREGLDAALRRRDLPRHLVWLSAAWMGWLGLTTALAERPARSWFGSYEWQQGLFAQLGLVGVAVLTFCVVRSVRDGRMLLRAATWGSLPITLYGLLQFFRLDPFRWAPWGDAGPVFSTLGNENYLGAYLAMLLSLTLAGLLISDNRLEKAGLVGLMALQSFCLYTTNSVAAMIAAALAAALVLWWRWQFDRRQAFVVLAGLLLASIIATFAVAVRGEAIGDFTIMRAGREIRPFTWATAYQAASAHPVTGWGIASFDLAAGAHATPGFRQYVLSKERLMDRAHNLWLELGVETGVPGLLLWPALAGAVGYAVLRSADLTGFGNLSGLERLGGLTAMVAYIVYLMANPSDLGSVTVFAWLAGWTLGVSFPQAAPVGGEAAVGRTYIIHLEIGRTAIQALLLVAIFGTVYGVRQWFFGARPLTGGPF